MSLPILLKQKHSVCIHRFEETFAAVSRNSYEQRFFSFRPLSFLEKCGDQTYVDVTRQRAVGILHVIYMCIYICICRRALDLSSVALCTREKHWKHFNHERTFSLLRSITRRAITFGSFREKEKKKETRKNSTANQARNAVMDYYFPSGYHFAAKNRADITNDREAAVMLLWREKIDRVSRSVA